ncbi:VOC family protein [Massilia sp. 9096]|uniref:VOC family protein n=1 Tax=Massilia sp. 9096 TaxID=1500894 RepID=UPI00069075D3|nr:VOC family protein [Massilia sp. 9096]
MSGPMLDIAYVRYQHPDLDVMRRFLTDFGLVEVEQDDGLLHMRCAFGYPSAYIAQQGPDSRLLSIGVVFDPDVLAEAAAWPEAVRRGDAPRFAGDGAVTVRAPEGYEFDLLASRAAAPGPQPEEPAVFNHGTHKTRLNAMRLVPPRPPVVLRLGHVALKVRDVAATAAWYRERFGLRVSDSIHEGDPGLPVTAFLRCDLGPQHADHHVIALAGGGDTKPHHISFEVQGLDEVGAGGKWMEMRGYQRLWGVGRHLLGGQIFDYWRDPYGNNVEHYADGDVFDADQPTQHYAQSLDTLYQWGPPLPADFAE